MQYTLYNIGHKGTKKIRVEQLEKEFLQKR